MVLNDFPDGLDDKVSAHNSGDLGSILAWENLLEKGMATPSSILAPTPRPKKNNKNRLKEIF